MPAKNIEVIEDKNLSSNYDKRYVVVDKDTGEVLDDAQGYGYRSVQKAYAAYGYKTRDKSKDAEKRLDAIAAADELGAGFTLAMQDLEIRGAGEILGEGQSGEMKR